LSRLYLSLVCVLSGCCFHCIEIHLILVFLPQFMDFTWLECRPRSRPSPSPFRPRNSPDRSASQRRQMIYIKREISAVLWFGGPRKSQLHLRSDLLPGFCLSAQIAAVDGGVFCLNCVRQAMVQF